MTSILIDISKKVDPETLATLRLVETTAERRGIPIFVIGATARDLVLHYHYGAAISRATQDVDFAIQIPDWHSFNALKDELLKAGFTQHQISHRLLDPCGGWIDLVPFGQISNDGKTIEWPPQGDVVMSILGFVEAHQHAVQVRIHSSPNTVLSVVSPVGLALLKLISWSERAREKRPNDAKDLLYTCRNYQKIPEVFERIYSMQNRMESYGWEPELGAAYTLGCDVRAIAEADTHHYIEQLFSANIAHAVIQDLVRESCDSGSQYERHEAVINAFIDGYSGH